MDIRRSAWFGRLSRAVRRYDETSAGLLAAGVSYYSFFATLSLTVFGLAMAGLAFRDAPGARDAVAVFVAGNLPRLNVDTLLAASGKVGLVAMAGFVLSGLWWVEATWSAIRAIWRLPRDPGTILIRYALDLAVLAGLGLLLAASIGVRLGVGAATDALLPTAAGWVGAVIGFGLGLAVNTVLAAALLEGVPRLRMPVTRIAGPALLLAVGVEILKSLGGIYVTATVANPAYKAVGAAVGLLVFLYVANQLLLFAAALTATGGRGTVYDLGCHRRLGPADRRPIASEHGRP